MLLVPTSLVIFFLTGATWPQEAMPRAMAILSNLLPATHGSRAILLADAMQASAVAVMRPLANLLALSAGLLGTAAVVHIGSGRSTRTVR